MLLPMFETVVISHSLICGRYCKPLWQMEMPLYCFGYHFRLMLLPYHVLADVIAFALVVDVKTTTVSWDGWCYCHVAGVIATAGWCGWQILLPVADGKATRSFYFSFSSEVLTRTSSQTCGRWYLPTFLLRDGSLTLIYRASFIVLIWFKSSLPIILKQRIQTCDTTSVTI